MGYDSESRKSAAVLIRSYFEGTVSLDDLIPVFQNSEDPLVQAALDLVMRQPKRGFLGVSERHWKNVYWPRVLYILEQLDAGDQGAVPPAPLYPVADPLRLAGYFLLLLLCFYGALGHALKGFGLITESDPLPRWADLIAAVFWSYIVVQGIRNLRYRFWLFRQWGGASPVVRSNAAGRPVNQTGSSGPVH